MSRLMILLLAFLTACAGYSENHRRGLIVTGAASVFIGGVIALDGAACDESAGGDMECDEENSEVLAGASLIAFGLLVGGVGYLVKARAAD